MYTHVRIAALMELCAEGVRAAALAPAARAGRLQAPAGVLLHGGRPGLYHHHTILDYTMPYYTRLWLDMCA